MQVWNFNKTIDSRVYFEDLVRRYGSVDRGPKTVISTHLMAQDRVLSSITYGADLDSADKSNYLEILGEVTGMYPDIDLSDDAIEIFEQW